MAATSREFRDLISHPDRPGSLCAEIWAHAWLHLDETTAAAILCRVPAGERVMLRAGTALRGVIHVAQPIHLKAEEGVTPLLLATRAEDPRLVELLLRYGANVDHCGEGGRDEGRETGGDPLTVSALMIAAAVKPNEEVVFMPTHTAANAARHFCRRAAASATEPCGPCRRPCSTLAPACCLGSRPPQSR